MLNFYTKLTIADKISLTIISFGFLAIIMVYITTAYYKNLAYQHHDRAIKTLATLQINEQINHLKNLSSDLAVATGQQTLFLHNVVAKNDDALVRQLDTQFQQYFVTAGIFKLLKLYVLDAEFSLISQSSEGIKTKSNTGLICPDLSREAYQRVGPEKLQVISTSCRYMNRPVYAVIVPLGGLKPKGYIQVVVDLPYRLRKIEAALGMSIQIDAHHKSADYHSPLWDRQIHDEHFLPVSYKCKLDDNSNPIIITLMSDMTDFNRRVDHGRNIVMFSALCITVFVILLILYILQRSALPPLARIQNVLARFHLKQHTNLDGRLAFTDLLEQIITLKKNQDESFTVMILDINQFKLINEKYSYSFGDECLKQIEQRLKTNMRDTDLISWVGTDTPGHKLLPTDQKTEYRSTIARLGGDEFGLVLPSIQSTEQVAPVIQRIIDTISGKYTIENTDITINCTIGASIYPNHGDDEKQLIRNADKAMFTAKSKQLKYCIFTPESV